MTYSIRGLEPAPFAPLFAMQEDELSSRRAVRLRAKASAGYPCRVSLRDADEGDELVLIHHVNHDVETPYRNAFAIYIRKDAGEAGVFIDECPPVFAGRPITLRGYDADGMLAAARLPGLGEVDTCIRELLEDRSIAYIDAHNAAHGCFAARIERQIGRAHV